MDAPNAARTGRHAVHTEHELKESESFASKAATVANKAFSLVVDTYLFIPLTAADFVISVQSYPDREAIQQTKTVSLIAFAVIFNLATIPFGTAGTALRLGTTALLVFRMISETADRSRAKNCEHALMGHIVSNFFISWGFIKYAKMFGGAKLLDLSMHVASIIAGGAAVTAWNNS